MKIIIDNLDETLRERLVRIRARNIRELGMALNIICLPIFLISMFLKGSVSTWILIIGLVLLAASMYFQIKFAEKRLT